MTTKSQKMKMITAFSAIYIIWGSTFLAIRYAIETIPPFLMSGCRFVIAGTMLVIWSAFKSHERPTFKHWLTAAIIGGLLFVGGNGGLVWAEQIVPSGFAALILASIPIWMIILDSLRKGGNRITMRVFIGLVAGIGGMILLINPGNFLGGESLNIVGAIVLVFAAFSWSVGSLYSKSTKLPYSSILTAGMEMLCGGFFLLLLGFLTGDGTKLIPSQISLLSGFALFYLIIFGSVIAFTAYIWLLNHTSPTNVATYAFVNPIVALFIGWIIGGEFLTIRSIIAASLIILAVFLIITQKSQQQSIPPSSSV